MKRLHEHVGDCREKPSVIGKSRLWKTSQCCEAARRKVVQASQFPLSIAAVILSGPVYRELRG